MGRSARVMSIDVLQTLGAAVQKFRGEAAGALDDLEIEVRRALEWIHHDRKEYWVREMQRGSEGVTQARLHLQQAKMARRIGEHEPACIDEKRALDRAKRRLETAEEKVKAVRHWAGVVDRAVEEFQANRTHFAAWLDVDLPKAVSALNHLSESLAGYLSIKAPSDSNAPIFSPGGSNTENGKLPERTSSDKSSPPANENELPGKQETGP